MTTLLAKTALRDAMENWLKSQWRVAGPCRQKTGLQKTGLQKTGRPGTGSVRYAWLSGADELLLEGFVRPVNSIKEFLLPRHETLFAYQGRGRQTKIVSPSTALRQQVVVAARPCDAAALPRLDHVFNWDYRDRFYNQRRKMTTVVTLACSEHDEHCFCTSLGIRPDSEEGSDVVLLPVDDEYFEVRCVTDKGSELLRPWTEQGEGEGTAGRGPEPHFDPHPLREQLAAGVDESFWQQVSLPCLGCGACAHHCPACHCFDMVDQVTADGGRRVRNWDSCQGVVYSLHASGHNPRGEQAARQRNRIVHKYQTYPQKFGPLLCTGCGACGRNCPAGLGVRPVLQQLADLQAIPREAFAPGTETAAHRSQ